MGFPWLMALLEASVETGWNPPELKDIKKTGAHLLHSSQWNKGPPGQCYQ